MKSQRSAEEILAFIDAARRLPPGPKKELWVSWLVTQYECRISGPKFSMSINTDDANFQEKSRRS
jgi:hypothetical protein